MTKLQERQEDELIYMDYFKAWSILLGISAYGYASDLFHIVIAW